MWTLSELGLQMGFDSIIALKQLNLQCPVSLYMLSTYRTLNLTEKGFSPPQATGLVAPVVRRWWL